ncbi:unnamed protein product [Umbelopsis vinacea]
MKFTAIAAALVFAATSVSAVRGPVAGCKQLYTVKKGDSCEAVSHKYKISVSELVSLNHGLHWGPGHYCDNLDVGRKYCVKGPSKKSTKKKIAVKKSSKKSTKKTTKKHTTKKSTTTKKASTGATSGPIAHKTIASCKTYHLVTNKDSCTSLMSEYHISSSQFFKWNSGVHHSADHDCDNLDTGKRYCVKA